jgi:hypothetical protein
VRSALNEAAARKRDDLWCGGPRLQLEKLLRVISEEPDSPCLSQRFATYFATVSAPTPGDDEKRTEKTVTQSNREETMAVLRSSLDHFDAAVEVGGCVIAAERSVIVSMVQETTRSGKSATFYLTKPQFDEIMNWYWTPERMTRLNVEAVSVEEQQRIVSELGVKDAGFNYSNRIKCPKCGSVYGAFEFVQQGIREHGREIVETALNLANSAIVRVNPSTIPVCQNCKEVLSGGGVYHSYAWDTYGCCMQE